MKPFPLLPAGAALAFLLTLAVSTATAGTTGNGWSQQQEPDLRYLVTAVDTVAGTVQVEFMRDKKFETYTIDANTKVRVGNVMGTIDQIKVGMQVRKSFVRQGQTLGAIVVDQADPPPAVPPPPANK